MLLTTSTIQNKDLADYLFTLLSRRSEKGIPDVYTQKAKAFGRMFDEKFAESLPKHVENGCLTVDVCSFISSTALSGKVDRLNVDRISIDTHYGRISWIAYFLDTPDSACISPFSKKENPFF